MRGVSAPRLAGRMATTLAPKTAPDDATHPWGASVVATLVTLFVGLCAWLFVRMMPIECQMYCDEAELRRYDDTYRAAFRFFMCGLSVPLLALLESYRLAWRRQHPARRILLTLAAPVSMLFLYVITESLLDPLP